MPASNPRWLNSEPNVVPMIDVLLVLLIIFMIVVVVPLRSHLDIQLPDQTDPAGTGASIVLEVGPGPTYAINSRPIDRSDIERELTRLYRDRPEKVIFVSGDPTARYHEIITAFDIARGAGVTVAGLSSRP